MQKSLAYDFLPTHLLQVLATQIDGKVSASYAKEEEYTGEKQAGGMASRDDLQPFYRLKCEVVQIK